MSEYGTSAGGGEGSIAAQAQQKVQESTRQASQAGSKYVREQVQSRGKQAAEELQSLAGALRRTSQSLRDEGKSSTASGLDGMTSRVETVGRYLGGTGGDAMLRDIEAFGRRRPWGLIGIGLGVGIAASRFLKASSGRRFEQSRADFVPRPYPQHGELAPRSVAGSATRSIPGSAPVSPPATVGTRGE